MKKSKILGLLTIFAATAITLTACGSGGSKSNAKIDFSTKVKNTKAPIKGGTLKVAIETDTPFTGIFNSNLSDSAIDSEVSQYGNESLVQVDKNYKYVDGGATNIKIDQVAKTATFTINDKVKWSDGKPLVAKDIVYSYEIIGNKETKSSRYTQSLQNIVGMEAYHAGTANSISGIEMPNGEDGKEVVIHFTAMKPGMKQSGNGYILEYASPYHQLKDVPFAKLTSSDEIRKTPLFYGPYKMNKLVRGQSAEWVPNEYYYRGKPKLAKIVATVVNPNSVTQSIKSQKYDVAKVVNSQWDSVKGTANTDFVAEKPLYYSYLAFKVGKWDAAKGENVQNPNAKMGNQALRQAIAYAMNVDQVSEKYSKGLSFRVNTLIPENFSDYYDKSAKGFPLNIKKANELLDKAGYKKKGDYRQTPDGKDLVINLAAMSGDKTQEAIVQNYIQQWKSIGLNVKLATGRLIEFNSFYDKVQNDDPAVDMFMAAWSLSSEPSPSDLYSPKAPYNYSRFNQPEQTKLLEDIDSEQAFDQAYRVDAFKKWQVWMDDNAYVVPLTSRYDVYAVNNRVTGYELTPSAMGNVDWFKVGVSK